MPWTIRIAAFVENPTPVIPILEALKDDQELYVLRSVTNHLEDITKDHPELAYAVCERWLVGSSNERRWLIPHALRYPAKKGDKSALKLRFAAKAEK